MAFPPAESFQNNRAMGLGSTGTIVLSSSCFLLFIDRTAIDLLGELDPEFPAQRGTQLLPPCLMTVVREFAATYSALDSGPHSPLARMSRLLGPQSQPVRVQGFTVPYRERHDIRIVLVLSRCDEGAMA